MLDHLPNELIEHIFRLAVQGRGAPSEYNIRQRTLCTLCLVSRRYHTLAVPLLEEVGQVSDGTEFEVFEKALAQRPNLGKALRSLTVDGNFDSGDLQKLVLHCPSLSELRVAYGYRLDLRVYEGHDDLRLLSFYESRFSTAPFTLAPVQRLILERCVLPNTTFLSGSSFPSLQHLFLPGHSPGRQQWREDSQLSSFLQSLETVTIRYGSTAVPFTDPIKKLPALIDLPFHTAKSFTPHDMEFFRHLRFYPSLDEYRSRSLTFRIEGLRTALTSCPPARLCLRRLYLPMQALNGCKMDEGYKQKLDLFLHDCKVRGIIVDFEEVGPKEEGESLLSPAFMAAMKREKEEREREKQNTA